MTATRLDTVKEYYFSKKLREVAIMIAEGKSVINMGIGSPDLPAHPEVVTALKESFSNPKVHQYQSYQGIPELRIAIPNFTLSIIRLPQTPIVKFYLFWDQKKV